MKENLISQDLGCCWCGSSVDVLVGMAGTQPPPPQCLASARQSELSSSPSRPISGRVAASPTRACFPPPAWWARVWDQATVDNQDLDNIKWGQTSYHMQTCLMSPSPSLSVNSAVHVPLNKSVIEWSWHYRGHVTWGWRDQDNAVEPVLYTLHHYERI